MFFETACPRLLPLADSMFLRARPLTERGLQLHELDRLFVLDVCGGSAASLAEQQAWDIYAAKREISRANYDNVAFVRDLEARRARAEALKQPWEAYPTNYLKTYRKLWRQVSPQLAALENKYNDLATAQWAKEVEQLATLSPKGLSAPHERVSLAIARFNEIFGALGFESSPRLSQENISVLYKSLPTCGLISIMNLAELQAEIFGSAQGVYGRVGRPTGPRVEILLAAIDPRSKTVDPESPGCAVIRFEWLLPIRKAPLWTDYSTFYSDGELDALVRAHGRFYEVIRAPLEAALS